MLINLKKIIIIAAAASVSTMALADIKKETKNGYSWLTSTSLGNVLTSARNGEGYKIEGQQMKLEGWLASVETSKGNDGTPIFILQITDAFSIDLPGLRKNSAYPNRDLAFYCATDDRSKVQKLDKDKLVKFNAEIREVKTNSYSRDYGATNSGMRMVVPVKQHAVLAKCNFL